MTPAALSRLGTLLYGPCWRIPLADALRVNRRTLRRWLAGEWQMPDGLPADLKRLMRERIAELREEIESL